MLEVRALSAAYGQHPALDGASLRVDKGEIVVILGANGAGKSTLLKAVCGICEGRVSGSATVNGHELIGAKPDRIVEEGIALVPEGRGIFGDLSVEENLTLGSYPGRARNDEAAILTRVYGLFPKLRERRRQTVRTMSGGEQQMVAIGRAMMSNPSILALDEPSLGLSPLLSKELFQSLKAVSKTGIGILLVEQNARASLAIADRGYLLENTKIIHEDSAEALARDPAVQRAYLGGAATKPATAKASTPVQSPEPRPRTGPSPSDIAAAAMQKLAPKPAQKPVQPSKPTPPPAPKPIAPAPKTPAPVPQPTVNGAGSSKGIEIDSLVNRARQISASQHKPQTPVRHSAMPPAPTVRSTTPMPDLSAHDDRLRAVLEEIETAAARARRGSGPRNHK